MDTEQKAIYEVFGYVRRSQKELQKSSNHLLFQTIPALVTSIIISYYFSTGSFEIAGDGVDIHDDNYMILKKKKGSSWDNSSYTLPVPSTTKKICKWDLKIHNALKYEPKGSYISLGISSGVVTGQQFIYGKGVKYGYAGWNGHSTDNAFHWFKSYGEPYGISDTVSVELDLINKQVIFYKNEQSQGVAHSNIKQGEDIEYRLAISMCHVNTKIELLNYSERYK